jgi:hypothetical protein
MDKAALTQTLATIEPPAFAALLIRRRRRSLIIIVAILGGWGLLYAIVSAMSAAHSLTYTIGETIGDLLLLAALGVALTTRWTAGQMQRGWAEFSLRRVRLKPATIARQYARLFRWQP